MAYDAAMSRTLPGLPEEPAADRIVEGARVPGMEPTGGVARVPGMEPSGGVAAEPSAGPTVADETWTHLVEVCIGVVREHLTRTVAELDLAPTQALALRRLEPGRPLPMGELAEELRCDPSNVTGVIDRLEARGLVARRTASADRRVKTLVLTAEGAALRERLMAQFHRAPAALGALSPAEQQQLGDLLRRVLAGSHGARDASCPS
jgi:DNA-binding MarR family transcriptional regulator